METIYRVVCPDGQVPTKWTTTNLIGAVHEAITMNQQHGDCDGDHIIETATWVPIKEKVTV